MNRTRTVRLRVLALALAALLTLVPMAAWAAPVTPVLHEGNPPQTADSIRIEGVSTGLKVFWKREAAGRTVQERRCEQVVGVVGFEPTTT